MISKRYYAKIIEWGETLLEKASNYTHSQKNLIVGLMVVALCTYGFELFNLNITIDEEVHSVYSGPTLAWITTGRWGMYLLNRFLISYTIIPFVPLCTALVFHIGGMVLLLDSWEVNQKWEQIMVGAIGIIFPSIAYLYTFSTINFGVGFGYFCVALSLFIYVKNDGSKKFLASLPAAYSIAIYQGFVLALAGAYLANYISILSKKHGGLIKELISMVQVFILASLIYYAFQKIFLLIFGLSVSDYTDQYFHISSLWSNFGLIVKRLWDKIMIVYTGDKAIYGTEISLLSIIIVMAVIGFLTKALCLDFPLTRKALLSLLSATLLLLPFMGGFLTQGYLAMRFLVALPITTSAIVMLGLRNKIKIYRLLMFPMMGLCLFQFTMSSNHLFASSHLALQKDRLLASNIIERINAAKAYADSSESVKYLDVIGYYENKGTSLMPKSETFGASFFEWDQGNVHRILLFMQTIGYDDLQALPSERRGDWIMTANSMPAWPDEGSVLVTGDTVLLKFGPYSNSQRSQICLSRKEFTYQIEDFCP